MKEKLSLLAVATMVAAASPALAAYQAQTMMATSPEFDDLTAAVTENTDQDDSVVQFINGLAPMLEAAAGDRQATVALAAKLREKAAAVAEAIRAHTPAEGGGEGEGGEGGEGGGEEPAPAGRSAKSKR